ncbi:MAG: sulfatase-like hydrolase/transferase [Candidatus Latescibacteria bacterium]|jgi:arylsulfatase A-like enzyme|nr:sulfatase-like hydrolase/transferase [Candidatus Latescibacterota bacterium]
MPRPNILILYTDQQRWDALGANGDPEIKTPNLDRLASQGINFPRFFVQNPVCMPSRVSLLSSRYPSSLGIYQNGTTVPSDTLVLPMMLSNYGYHSANLGKLHFLPHANRDHADPHPPYGFDTLAISDEPGCYDDAYRAWVRNRAPDQLDHISVGLPPARAQWEAMMGAQPGIAHPDRERQGAVPFPADDGLTHTAFVANQTIEFIRRHRDRPFMAIGGFYSPHSPWVTPQRFLDLYDPASLPLPEIPEGWQAPGNRAPVAEDELRSIRQGYYGMVSEVDHYVGQILDCLDAEGLAENTIVIFTSDHGEYLGDYHMFGKGAPGMDCISRVPFVVRWPAGAERGLTHEGIVEAVDVVPALLEACGIPIPPSVQGRSLLPAVRGESDPGRDCALTEAVRTRSIRTEGHRYVIDRDGRETLHDLSRDPNAYINVAQESAYASVLAEHRRMLLEKLFETCTPLRREWAY